MTQTAEALTDTDLAILRAYAAGDNVGDIATANRLTREDVGFRLAGLCTLKRDVAQRLVDELPDVGAAPVDPVADTATSRILTDTEQEVMRSFGGGHDADVIAKAKRLDPAEVHAILRLVGHPHPAARNAARAAGRTGIVTISPATPAPARQPDPAPSAAVPTTPEPAAETTPAVPPRLTPRQAELLQLLATDLDFDGIAAQLSIATSTAYRLAATVYRALGASGRAGTVATATRLGLLTASGPGRPAPAMSDDITERPDITAVLTEHIREIRSAAPPATTPDPTEPTDPIVPTTPEPGRRTEAGPTVEISIIRAGRTWTTVVELDPDDTDTTVNVRVQPPAGAR